MIRRKSYNPTWDGYLGDYLNGKVGINQLTPQHEFFDSIGLEKVLSDNTQYHYMLTLAQAQSIIEDINPSPPQKPSYGEEFARGSEVKYKKKNLIAAVFSVTDPISTYAGNIYDSHGFSDVCREFKRLNITAKTYVGENGKKYIHLSGHAGLRRLVRGTRYGASHPQMLAMGIGQQGLNASIIKGVRFCIVFSIGYRLIESIFKDEYTLADFIGNITMDMAKTAIIAASSWIAGSLLTATAFLGGSIIAVAGIVLAVGIIVAIGLDLVDKQYGISEKLIALLKEAMERKPRTPEVDLQYFFNTMGRIR
ncbi:membrane protein [Xenorhabdus budapestensis]|uniref:Membrane protein n=1 Tax=Xenorhabdus budapestensis TaxID=290110 RepID=A0A2D0J2Z4_XENBU|nr:membrane protein [Xenorhabdus budapestensis]